VFIPNDSPKNLRDCFPDLPQWTIEATKIIYEDSAFLGINLIDQKNLLLNENSENLYPDRRTDLTGLYPSLIGNLSKAKLSKLRPGGNAGLHISAPCSVILIGHHLQIARYERPL
jgi:hypothetical protein